MNGTRDTSFGIGGIINPSEGGSLRDYMTSIAVDSQGRIILGQPIVTGATTTTLKLYRYNSNGTLDTTFGNGGTQVISGVEALTGLKLDQTGQPTSTVKIKIAADDSVLLHVKLSGSESFGLYKLGENGQFDQGFGSAGLVIDTLAATSFSVTDEGNVKFYKSGFPNGKIHNFINANGKLVYDAATGEVALTYNEGTRPIGLLNQASNLSDADLADTNYEGASLSLKRLGDANAQDIFGARGKLQFGESGDLLWESVVIGQVTNGEGNLTLTFNSLVTQTVLDELVRSITYRNASSSLSSQIKLEWVMNDNDPAGSKQSTAVQTLNLRDDNADIGDPSLVTKLNNKTVSFTNMIEVGGKYYYLLSGTNRNDFDTIFNAGNDTTVDARSISREDGSEFKLLTVAEIKTFLASTEVQADTFWSKTSQNNLLFSASDLGTRAGSHSAFYASNLQTIYSFADTSGMQFNGIVEVTPGAISLEDPFIEPAVRLLVDNGESETDRLTSDGRFEVVGLNTGLAIEVSQDGGASWSAYAAGTTVFELGAGTFETGKIKVRQTDASGFVDIVSSTATYKIDKNIKSVSLFNDQGLKSYDGKTADGRVILTGITDDAPYEYSLDGGANWTTGGTLGTGVYGFVLPTGSYAKGDVRIRQTDADGFVTSGRSTSAYIVDPIDGQGSVALLSDNGEDKTDNVTSDERVLVMGPVSQVPISVSFDGGSTWATIESPSGGRDYVILTLTAGSYAAGDVVVRQTDAKGFVSEVRNPAAFLIDKNVKSLDLLNDQGLSSTDGKSADGRILATGFDDTLGYEYSIDNGVTWTAGTRTVEGLMIFSLPEGAYQSQFVQVRQTDANNLTVTAKSTRSITVSQVDGQGALSLDLDSGSSSSDGLTNAGRVTITGLVGGTGWEYSTDAGQTWTNGTAVSGAKQSFVLSDGAYNAGDVRVRQTDTSGFTTTVANTAAYQVDTAIADVQVSLVEDSGYSNSDNLTANGAVRFAVSGILGEGDIWSYSIDAGKTWVIGSGTGAEVVLADGTYAARTVQIKVTDAAGNASFAALDKKVVVDSSDTTAPVFIGSNISYVADYDGTATNNCVPTYSPVHTIQTTDASAVYYSLSGQDAALFNISSTGQIFFKASTQLKNPAGDLYSVTATAIDAFGNSAQQEVKIGVVDRFKATGKSVEYSVLRYDGETYEITFSHPIELNSSGSIRFKLKGSEDVILDINDPTQVRVDGNRLIVSTTGLTGFGRYKLAMVEPVKSALTGEVIKIGIWEDYGFTKEGTVVYENGVLNPRGSFTVTTVDGVAKTGSSVIIGDVNGDGIDDWAMSSPTADSNGRTDNGKIYVVYGRADGVVPNLSVIATNTGGFLISGARSGDLAGAEVSAAGDVNGDGFADIAIFASGANGGTGKGYVVFGQAQNGSVDLAGVESNAALGRVYTNSVKDSFGGIGDINGDGRDDIAHGRVDLQRTTALSEVSYQTTYYTVPGKITLKADWLSFAADWAEAASLVNSFFDDPFAAVIETGLSYDEALELALGGNDGEIDEFGQAVLDMIKELKSKLPFGQSLDSFTYTQSGGSGGGLFSTPKDTVYDFSFKIKATQTTTTTYTTTLLGAGEVIVELGSAGTKRITGTINGQQVGTDVVALGDINGDGKADFGVLDTGSGGVLARMNVVYGTGSTTELFTNNFDNGVGGFRITDPFRTTEYVGEGNITGLGDVNGDGINDFSVTLDAYSAATYVVYGKANMTGVNLAQVANGIGGYKLEDASQSSSTHIEAIGDYNGDGLDDFVYYYASNRSDRGFYVYVVYGGESPSGVPTYDKYRLETNVAAGFSIEAASVTDAFALRNVISAGDINGDGLTDLMIRGSNGQSIVLTGSSTSGKFSQVPVDQMGTQGNDLLTSTGSQLIAAGLGDDVIATLGADVVRAGAGNDRIILGAGTLAALEGKLGTNGNTDRLATLDGGGGIDTLQLLDGATLDLTRISNKMLDMDNISSRLSSIERIDLATDTASNTLRLNLNDVLDMGSANAFNTAGWQNLTGQELGANSAKHQLAIDGAQGDKVEIKSSEWYAANATVKEIATGNVYSVYRAFGDVAAQLLIDTDSSVVFR